MTLQGLDMLAGLLGQDLRSWLKPLASTIGDFGDFVFFQFVLHRLEHDIRAFGDGVIGRVMEVVQWVALALLTAWVLIQGYRVMTGQMRESLMQLMVNTLRAVLIVTAAVAFSTFDEPITSYVTQDMKAGIHWVITGEEGEPEDAIDSNLGWLQVAMSSVDVLESGGDLDGAAEKERAVTLMGFGTAGPAIMGGALLLMYQVAMALFIGLGPIFILCLLFNSTRSLFQRWLLYGIGTMFSLAVLSAMVSIALDMVTDVAIGMWTTDAVNTLFLQGGGMTGYNSRALMSGGMGMILTLLLLTVPPMVANFFQGTLGGFMHYSAFGGALAAAPSASGPAGTPAPPAYQPSQPVNNTSRETSNQTGAGTNYGATTTHPASGLGTQSTPDAIKTGGSPLREQTQTGPDPNAGRYTNVAPDSPSAQPSEPTTQPPPKDRT